MGVCLFSEVPVGRDILCDEKAQVLWPFKAVRQRGKEDQTLMQEASWSHAKSSRILLHILTSLAFINCKYITVCWDQVSKKCFQKLRCWGVVQRVFVWLCSCFPVGLLSYSFTAILATCSQCFPFWEPGVRQPELALHPTRMAHAEFSYVAQSLDKYN